MLQYIPANPVKFFVYFSVGISQNFNSNIGKIIVPNYICFFAFLFIVLRAIQFNHQCGGRNIEICDVISYNLLSANCHRQSFKEIIPQMPFFPGHVFTEILGIRF